MKFSENLYNLRKNQKLSQEKLAEKLGVSRQSVSKWENGTAYPEMNRILELCKIFHCQLNDLVNDQILDFDSLDEEVKMNVVKFNKEKQKKLKRVSKSISVCSKIIQIITLIASVLIFNSIFLVPFAVNNLNITNEEFVNENMDILDKTTSDVLIKVFKEHSKTELIIYGEIIVVCAIISLLVLSCAMLYLAKLFKNISEGDTPFTTDNLKNIKIATILFIVYLVFPVVSGTLFQWITKIDMDIDFDITKIFYILITICIYYVFDYGHQIQLDSKGRIYGDENE